MTSPVDPGATGRKARGGATAQAPAAPDAPAPPVEGDTSAAAIAAAGTAGEVAQAADKSVVVGDTETPVKPGGPGVGAERVAEPVEAVASRPMAGSEASIAALTAAERAELEGLRRERSEALAPGITSAQLAELEGLRRERAEALAGGLSFAERAELEDLRSAHGADLRHAEERSSLEVEHVETNRRLGARRGLVVDAAAIPDIRLAQAAARIQRDGRPYAVGQPVPVDFEAYTELVGIGAIVNDRWADLPKVGEA